MGKEKTVIFQATGIDNSVCMTAQSQHLRLGGCFVSIVFFDFFIDKIGEWVIIAIFVSELSQVNIYQLACL